MASQQSYSREESIPGKTILQLVSNPARNGPTKIFGIIVSQKQVKNSFVLNVLKIAWARFGAVRMADVDD